MDYWIEGEHWEREEPTSKLAVRMDWEPAPPGTECFICREAESTIVPAARCALGQTIKNDGQEAAFTIRVCHRHRGVWMHTPAGIVPDGQRRNLAAPWN